MRTVLVIGVQVILALSATNSLGQNAPTYPHPPSKQACSDFRKATINYWRDLQVVERDCQERLFRSRHDPNDNVRIRCSPVGWPRACAAEIERSLCAQEEGAKLINQCDSEATKEALKAKAIDAAVDTAAKTVGGEGEKKIKELKTAYDEARELHGLIGRATDYSKLSYQEKLNLNRDIALKLNLYRNDSDLSKNLTEYALKHVTEIDKDALAELDRQMRRVSTSGNANSSGDLASIIAAQKAKNASNEAQVQKEIQVSKADNDFNVRSALQSADQKRIALRNDVEAACRSGGGNCQNQCTSLKPAPFRQRAYDICREGCSAGYQRCVAEGIGDERALAAADRRLADVDDALRSLKRDVANGMYNPQPDQSAEMLNALLNGFIQGLAASQPRYSSSPRSTYVAPPPTRPGYSSSPQHTYTPPPQQTYTPPPPQAHFTTPPPQHSGGRGNCPGATIAHDENCKPLH